MKNYKIEFNNLDWIAAGVGARYKIHKDKQTQVRLIEFSDNLEHPEWCITGHTAYVLEGCLEIKFETFIEVYETGSVLFIPEGECHKHIPRPLTPLVRLFSVEKP